MARIKNHIMLIIAVMCALLTSCAMHGDDTAETGEIYAIAHFDTETIVEASGEVITDDSPAEAFVSEVKISRAETEAVMTESIVTPETITAIATSAEVIKPESTICEETSALPLIKSAVPDIPNGKYILILNNNTLVYHVYADCSFALKINSENRQLVHSDSIHSPEKNGYRLCSYCERKMTGKHTEVTSASNCVETEVRSEDKCLDEQLMYTVIVNTKSGIFHADPNCRHVSAMKEENKLTVKISDPAALICEGYKPCGTCSKQYKND